VTIKLKIHCFRRWMETCMKECRNILLCFASLNCTVVASRRNYSWKYFPMQRRSVAVSDRCRNYCDNRKLLLILSVMGFMCDCVLKTHTDEWTTNRTESCISTQGYLNRVTYNLIGPSCWTFWKATGSKLCTAAQISDSSWQKLKFPWLLTFTNSPLVLF